MMPLTPAALSAELQNMPLVDIDADAVNNMADAFTNYFYDASVAGITCTAGSLDAAKAAMVSAMLSGWAANAAAALQAGCLAFWGVVSPAAATIWITVPPVISSTPAPGVAGLAAALAPVFAANVAAELDTVPACDAIAAAWHPTNLGGIAIQQLPPAPPTPVPIL
jgi:hypothetical protein